MIYVQNWPSIEIDSGRGQEKMNTNSVFLSDYVHPWYKVNNLWYKHLGADQIKTKSTSQSKEQKVKKEVISLTTFL